ncbi:MULTISPECIES: trypsin-like serine peptidase [Paraburkholderia]|jgi:V8-like Glu-specific endopeptidase|uniref:Serine protease n=2 Tax=Paraburkholderia madseniana TaxID=2599607 RepID=A0A6N6WBR4_9BURK|nr:MULTISPECIES: hypothetical protein [Paraburkholderia]KAE8756970.1 hypothetical protein FSO04_26395 [Paraburkholderia madseniana]MCX4176167.1 hypothetical protein [Paraburkholderia madseniana]MDQ6464161.1 hypothetical protein [Paraburkholderia madseniana]
MTDKPMTMSELEQQLKPRAAARRAAAPISFEPPVIPAIAGERAFPAPVKGTLLNRAEVRAQASGDAVLAPHVPEHIAFNPHRPALDERFRRHGFFDLHLDLPPGKYRTTTIFPPDQRIVFSDTAYPWSTVGKVDLGGGFGSGCLVGPRHLLCASHMMTWNADGTVNQVTFTPSSFDGNAPFGNSAIVHWYAYRKVVGPNVGIDDIEEDYVVLVLSNRLGDVCGWMGTRGYSPAWNGQTVWSHIGYPADISGGRRPTFQNGIAIDKTDGSTTDEAEEQRADVFPGQSGGPFFGWWTGDKGPSVTGVQSAQNPSTNLAGGGVDIVNLVKEALTAFP